MDQETNQETAAVEPQIEQIKSFDQFVDLLLEWHAKAVDTVLHLKDVPEGIEVKVENEEPYKLEGDVLKGFKLGLELALNYLGNLPFTTGNDDNAPTH